MQVRELTLMIGTHQIEAMTRFYGQTLGLPRIEKYQDPVFLAAETNLRLLDHSQIQAPTKEPARLQINLFIQDVQAEYDRIRQADPAVRVQRPPERESWGGLVTTLQDPDGNFVQLLEWLGD